tara:strand:+ start:1543 stop:1860 length:318 start_codon:yes stop_codon:yes gene_type:complete
MSPDIISQIIDLGGLASFACFLVIQFNKQQDQNAKLVSDFQTQLREITEDFDDRVEKMRARYDQVITEIREDCTKEKSLLREEARIAQRELLARERESIMNLKKE